MKKALPWSWLLVPLVALLELIGHFHFANAAPEPARWAELKKPVQSLHREGDLVITTPYWAEPNARAVFGDGLMPLRDVARPDETAYPRIIELAILGQRTDIQGLDLVEENEVGPFAVRVYQNTRYAEPLFDFVEQLGPETASAWTRRGTKETVCEWNARARVTTGAPALHGHPAFPKQRFECSRSEWNFVGVTVIEDENYRPRRCIWAHPGEKKETVVRFSDVPLEGRIRGHGGISWFLERESKGTPIEMEVLVDGDVIGTYHHEDGEGWKGFEFDTQTFRGQKRDVEFRVGSKRSKEREFCFHASVLK